MIGLMLANANGSFWMPEQGSSVAGGVDWLFSFVLWLSAFFFALVTTLLVVFVLRYRHRPGVARSTVGGHNTALELTWTIIPTILVGIIFYYGFRGYMEMAVEPPNAYEITASGTMWTWSFIYPNGHVDSELHVPAGVPVRMVLTSGDVIHSLYIPAFRLKKDAVPGRYNRMWFQAIKKDPIQPDEYDVYCAEYCGTNHSAMRTKAFVHEMADFRAWLERAGSAGSPLERGAKMFQTRGCAQCHTIDGSRLTGPSWKDLFGSNVPVLGGSTVVADENYIRESILDPNVKIRSGYDAVMSSYRGSMKDRDIDAIIAYMKSISVHWKGDLPTTTSTTQPADVPAANQ